MGRPIAAWSKHTHNPGGAIGCTNLSDSPPYDKSIATHLDGFDGVLDLKESSFWGEGVDPAVVLAPANRDRKIGNTSSTA